MHLKSPRIICRRKTDDHSAGYALLMELFDVIHADPDPRSASALIAAAQVNGCSIARQASEVAVAPTGVLET